MTMNPFAVQGNINVTGNIEVAKSTALEQAQAMYDIRVDILQAGIVEWEEQIFTATNNIWPIPARYKRADYTTYDTWIAVTENNGWEWTGGYAPPFEYYDLEFVTAPQESLVLQALNVKQAWSAVQEAQEQNKSIKPQGTSGDGARALDITAGSATWSFDLDNTWATVDFTTNRQGRLTLPNGASITSNNAELEAARQRVLDYSAGWRLLCDERNAGVDRSNRFHAVDPVNYPNSYTPYFWLNTDVLTTATQTSFKSQLTTMWQAQQAGPVTHLPISASFYNQMRAYLSLNTIASYEALLASTDINVGNYKFTFRSSDGALVLNNGAAVKSSTDSTIATVQAAATAAVAAWQDLRGNLTTYAIQNGITSQGWPFLEWYFDGSGAQAYLDQLNAAWSVQNAPSSPPRPLIYIPAMSTQLYNDLSSTITLVKTTYDTWKNLAKAVDVVAGNTTLTLLSDDKVQVPGIVQTTLEEDIVIRTRYAGASSPDGGGSGSGALSYINKDFTFGTNGTLTFPDATVQTTAYAPFTGSWTVPVGTTTVSFTVPPNGAYHMWVRANIPNGILSYVATVHVTNPNVPVIGSQRAYNYTDGGSPILLTSLPTQFIGTEGTIATGGVVGTANNRFDFGISNTSGAAQIVYYGYTKI